MNELDYLKEHYKERRKIISQNALSIKKGKIVFFGDSITEICDLEKYYKEYDCFNAGISGDSSSGLFDRIYDNVIVCKPSLVVLLCGINDLGNEKRSVEETLCNYKKIVEELHKNGIKALIQSVYPVSKSIDVSMEDIISLNKAIEEIASNYNYKYIDIFSILLNKNKDEICLEYTDDGLHPNKYGYELISKKVKEYLL